MPADRACSIFHKEYEQALLFVGCAAHEQGDTLNGATRPSSPGMEQPL
jgi:hypothetical protein